MAAGCIYGLRQAGDSEIRYVGLTTQGVAARLAGHIAEAKQGVKNHRCNWLRSIDCQAEAMILEQDPVGTLPEAEKAWIATLRRVGCQLTNGTDGGETSSRLGFKATAETRAKLRAAHLGRKPSPAALAKIQARAADPAMQAQISAKLKGRKLPPETRAKMSAAKKGKRYRDGEPMPQWVRDKISATKKGQPHNGWRGGTKPHLPGCKCKMHTPKPCPPGCSCGRHTSISNIPCPPGCTCAKHAFRGKKCLAGCTCGRHKHSKQIHPEV